MLNIVPSNRFKLVYRIDNDELELFLFRTGTHADLF
jgi:mRNA-degrading endonuclease YafQ of YafQ-DinJ toxin-antitoxin module